jgi:NAD(P)-dependent dehydrogenase (short-subunit alcohol dehydrogenase family)
MAKTAPGVSVESSGTQVMSTLSGKRALVTGASRGIGRASALALAAAGAQVLVHVKEADGVVSEMRFCAGGCDETHVATATFATSAIGPGSVKRIPYRHQF